MQYGLNAIWVKNSYILIFPRQKSINNCKLMEYSDINFIFYLINDKNFVKPRLKMTKYRVFLSHRHMRNSRLRGEDESREQLHVLCQVMLSKRRFYAEKLWCPPADSRPLSSTTPKYDLQNIVSYIRCDFSGLKFSFCCHFAGIVQKKSVTLKILFLFEARKIFFFNSTC